VTSKEGTDSFVSRTETMRDKSEEEIRNRETGMKCSEK